jgi:Fur family peroxide stress response transcriptional regulator
MSKITHPIQPASRQAQELIAALKQAGLRLTPQRRAICRILAESREHPTAQALYNQLLREFSSLSRATVYNTLQTLVETGLVQELGRAGDGAIHYDGDSSPHVNLICTRCHRIEDLAGVSLADVARRVAEDSGYRLRGARVAYYGLCPRCQNDEAKRPGRSGRLIGAGTKFTKVKSPGVDKG